MADFSEIPHLSLCPLILTVKYLSYKSILCPIMENMANVRVSRWEEEKGLGWGSGAERKKKGNVKFMEELNV